MKAVTREKFGPPDVLEVREWERPVPGETELLVRVHATTVSRTDYHNLTGKPIVMRLVIGFFAPKARIPGTDFAGVIEAVGSRVRDFQVGDRVFGFNDEGLRTQAEYVSLSAREAFATIPPGMSFAEAAASLEGFHYAYNFTDKVDLREGSRVLVYGASGAIGSAAVQIVKYLGAEVTAVTSPETVEVTKSLGMDQVLDYTTQDFLEIGSKFDCILDAVGKSSYSRCKQLLEPRGVYLSSGMGDHLEHLYLELTTRLGRGKRVMIPFPKNVAASIAFVKEMYGKGKFRPLIDREFPLDQVADAYRYVASGRKKGNVILRIGPES